MDKNLDRLLADCQARMQRENDSVHMQRVATDVPALPEGKRLAAAAPYALPPPAREVQEGVVDASFGDGPPPPTQAPGVMSMEAGGAAGGKAEGKAEGEAGGCNCCTCAGGKGAVGSGLVRRGEGCSGCGGAAAKACGLANDPPSLPISGG